MKWSIGAPIVIPIFFSFQYGQYVPQDDPNKEKKSLLKKSSQYQKLANN